MPLGLRYLQWSDANESEITAEWSAPQVRTGITTVHDSDGPPVASGTKAAL
jgi:hypothetical protein